MISYPKGKIKVLLLENIHKDAYELFKKDGFDVTLEKDALDEDDLAKRIGEIHILGIRSKTNVTPKVLANARRLLSIGCFCIGTNQVDLEGAEKIAVPVFNAPYSNTRSVAELVIAEIIMLARKATDQSRDVHLGKWNKIAKGCFEVRGKTLGIVGYGHIGSQVSVLAESMGMKVIFFDVIAKLPLGNASPVATYEELLQQSDFITFHVPETEETENLFNKAHLAHIKPNSYLLNLSRGKVVNIEALAEGLKSGRIAGAGIDVYPEEPKSNDDPFKSPLQGLNNVILTPHVGGSTEEAQKNIGTEVAQKLLKFINNGSTTFSVNFPNIELGNLKPGFHRILNIHKNQPGFLRDINSIISEMGGNILSQHLSTSTNIGYLSMEIDRNLGDELKNKIKAHQHSIRTRILYLD
ncbi:D-3-phosphoglycerate dehydrogenase [Leptospira kobayashii]|uniref:D-3-phosphoglycerate dehydrogenase n=1 Tax=Leptospira kobayashii TaxID=1917830 RepID=A0ABN6KHI3_9LEPT|nr:phosphoglycerate dehydrogenase [Leptospira kobayashii]BDA79047.1 D-3-phosphoglycerate dehydrogenase [Leptospira kobayashii]